MADSLLSRVMRANAPKTDAEPQKKSLLDRVVGANTSDMPGTTTQEKPWISGTNLFTKTLDVLNTPQQAIFGGIQGALTGQPILESAERGAKENIGFGEILGTLGMEEGPIRTGFGFMGDVVLDPVNLIPIGAATKIATKTGLTKLPGMLGEAVHKALPRSQQLMHEFRKIRDATLRETTLAQRGASRKGVQLQEMVKRGAKEKGLDMAEAGKAVIAKAERPDLSMYQAMKKVGIDDIDSAKNAADVIESAANARKATGYATEWAPPTMNLDDPLDEAAQYLRTALDDNLHKEWIAKLGTKQFSDLPVEYVTHVATPEARKIFLKDREMLAWGKRWNPSHAYQLQRKLRMTVDEANGLAATGKLPGYEGRAFRLFEEDPAKVMVARLVAGEKAIGDANIFLRTAQHPELAKPIDDAVREGLAAGRYKQLSIVNSQDPRLKPLADHLKNYAFEPEIADALNSWYRFSIVGEKTHLRTFFDNIFDPVQSMWKKTTLFIFPAYHARNFVGNLWNNSLAGMWDATYYARAGAAQAGDFKKMVKIGDRQITKGDFYKELVDHNILNQFESYMAVGDTFKVMQKLGQEEKLLGRALRAGIDKPVAAGMEVGAAVENNARMAHYMWAIEQKGMSPFEAAQSVKKYLFDYDDLSMWEKATLRRAMPFYSWSRFNIPLQIRHLIDKPQQFQGLGDFINLMYEKTPVDDEVTKFLPQWMRENTAVPVGYSKDGMPEFGLLGGWLPAADLEKMSHVTDAIADQVTPLIKLWPELYYNVATFTGRPIEDPIGQKEKFLSVPMRKRWSHLLRTVRILNEIDTFQKAVTRPTGEPGITDLTSAVTRVLTGMKSYPFDVRKEKQYRFFDALEKSRMLRREARRGREYNIQNLLDLIGQDVGKEYQYEEGEITPRR